jgi:hypothetical protein
MVKPAPATDEKPPTQTGPAKVLLKIRIYRSVAAARPCFASNALSYQFASNGDGDEPVAHVDPAAAPDPFLQYGSLNSASRSGSRVPLPVAPKLRCVDYAKPAKAELHISMVLECGSVPKTPAHLPCDAAGRDACCTAER